MSNRMPILEWPVSLIFTFNFRSSSQLHREMRDTLKGSHTGFRLFLITCRYKSILLYKLKKKKNQQKKDYYPIVWNCLLQFCVQAVLFHHHWSGKSPRMDLTCWRDPTVTKECQYSPSIHRRTSSNRQYFKDPMALWMQSTLLLLLYWCISCHKNLGQDKGLVLFYTPNSHLLLDLKEIYYTWKLSIRIHIHVNGSCSVGTKAQMIWYLSV